MSKKITRQNHWLRGSLVAAGVIWASLAAGQGTVGLNAAGEIRFPGLNSAPPQETPLCFNSGSGFLGTCAQISGIRNIAWVAPQGGDYASPIQALNEVNNWCGVPSNGNRCLIRIAPGWYDLGSQQLEMKPFVDIQGSGWNMTILGGARGADNEVDAALVKGAVSSVLSHLTLVNNGTVGQDHAAGYAGENIATGSDVSPDLDHVTVKVGGDANVSTGIYLNNVADSRLERVWLEINGNKHCRGLMAENNESGGTVNRLHAHTTNNCDSAVGVFLKSVEFTIRNSNIDAIASGANTAYGVIIEETGAGDRFSFIRESDVGAEVETGSGNAIGVEFRGNGNGGIFNSVVVGEAASGSGHGVHFVSTAANAKVIHSALIGSTASVNDEAAQTNCKGNLDADLNDVGC